MSWSSSTGWNGRGWSRAAAGGGGGDGPGTGVWDASKKSPSAAINGAGLRADLAVSPYGNVACDTAVLAGKTWAEFTLTVFTQNTFLGVCNASHAFTDNGNAWGGGDANVTGLYLFGDGVSYTPAAVGVGKFNDATFQQSAVVGDTWMLEYDPSIATDVLGNACSNGAIRLKHGGTTGVWWQAPAGTLYFITGADAGAAKQITANFGASAAVNAIGAGYHHI